MMSSEGSTVKSPSADDDWTTQDTSHFQQELSAFSKGFQETR
jgi:hypothetical protein